MYHFCFLDVNHIHPRLHPDRELLWDGSCSFCNPGSSQLQTVQENQGDYIDDDYRGNDVLYDNPLLLGHWYEIMALYYVKPILTEISASRQDSRVLQRSKIIRIKKSLEAWAHCFVLCLSHCC